MRDMELKERLTEDARREGVCAKGFVQNPDRCMERGFPSLETLRREFSDIEDKGVSVGKTFNGEVFDKLQTYIFPDCKGTIRVDMDYENTVIPMLYFADGCNIRVECGQKNDPAINVPLYIAEDCKVVGAKTGNCNFKRKTIKFIKP